MNSSFAKHPKPVTQTAHRPLDWGLCVYGYMVWQGAIGLLLYSTTASSDGITLSMVLPSSFSMKATFSTTIDSFSAVVIIGILPVQSSGCVICRECESVKLFVDTA